MIKTIENEKELQAKITELKESDYDGFRIFWGFQVNAEDFTVHSDRVGFLMANDENENIEEIALIQVDVLRGFKQKDIIRFMDVSWDDNETYVYFIKEENLEKYLTNE